MLEAVIFDFDGTILDTESCQLQAWQTIAAEYGTEISLEMWENNIGSADIFDPVAHIQANANKAVDPAQLTRRSDEINLALIDQTPLMPGVEARLAEAQQLKWRIGLASSSPTRWLNYHLPRRGMLFTFEAVRGSTDVGGRMKPDPAVYLACLEALRVDPKRAVAFEDSAHGIRAAKAAGMYAVAVPNSVTYNLDFSHADLVIESLEQISLATLSEQLGA